MGDNPFLEAARNHFIPNFKALKSAAISNGALACTISGAGPTLVSLSTKENAQKIRDAQIAVSPRDSKWLISPVSKDGARTIRGSIKQFTGRFKRHHNFHD